MTIIVHHLENSRSQRILWLLEELGLPYEVRRYARDPKTFATKSNRLAAAQAELDTAETEWLELEMLREELGG